ncbi:MAG: DUF4394 domain-containing protein [Pegethrix bostrychoides GSE-TBD4-15B]|jgi:hypothetical protein|uniref:DUF4394 domain-containing protein n=1 Tax=Pegethrix bostrychoides GSE-TBD4-15B TaxID=2839662 RepID=A0A951PF86_9CYAN|nr:DUF4394 domain-containing protein [Pegethrix bostrychoides GSE-TBD4-15B]
MTSTSDSVQFFALNDDNTLISFNSSDPGSVTSIPIAGISGTLLGIDIRPADGLIYGLTTANKIYTIDPNGLPDTGTTLVSTLSQPFEGGTISGFDFNPVADRLRLVGDNDQDFRINVDTGDVTIDGTLAFAAADANAKVNPNITAAAYTNSFTGTTSTQLYDIDTLLNTLVLQNPPNDGTLTTIGELGINFDTLGGFDILSSVEGENTAFAVSNAMLYNVDLETGAATSLGMIGDDPSLNLQGLAVMRVMDETEMMPHPEMPDDLLGTGLNQLIDLGLDDLFSSDLDDFLAIAGVGLLNNETGSLITLFDEAGNDIDSFEIPPIDGTVLQQVAGSIDRLQDIILAETGPMTEISLLQS